MIPLRPFDRLKFFLERQLVKGTHYQLLVMASLIGLISLLGGLMAFGSGDPHEGVADSIWWAFLRLTDPGYLGDDEGVWRRIVSTILTVSGYVVFMGALIAILTQWLMSRMRTLEQGLTPVAIKHHIVVLGWTNRTLPLLRELLLSERFLTDIGPGKRLRLVVLADVLTPEITAELKSDLVTGKHFQDVILRSGSALNTEHLIRAACLHATAIIVPARKFGLNIGISSDVETIKVLLSLDGQGQTDGAKLPYVVAEIQDPRKADIAQRAYRGHLEVVAGDSFISRLMVQNVRHPGLSAVYIELLSHDIGNNFHIRHDETLAGRQIGDLRGLFQTSVLCGVVRVEGNAFKPYLNPPADFRIASGDALVLIAKPYDSATRIDKKTSSTPAADNRTFDLHPLPTASSDSKAVLVLGWSRKVPALLREFATHGHDSFHITIVSTRPLQERSKDLAAEEVILPDGMCQQIVADFTKDSELRTIDLQQYDSIMLISSDRLGSGEEADARSIVGYLLLEGLLEERELQPKLLLELSDPHNERLMGHRTGEVIISPLLLSHILAQVALQQELRPVFDELFSAGGAEISFRRPEEYGFSDGDYTFREIQQKAWMHGETALGICRDSQDTANSRQLELNPPRDVKLPLKTGDQIVMMMTN